MKDQERKLYKKYFAKFPGSAIWLIVIGALFIPLYGVGAIPLIIGIVMIVQWNKKPTDAEFDAMRNKDISEVEKLALKKLNLTEYDMVREPVVIYSPRFWNIAGAEIGFKKGKDNIVRYMPIDITIIAFTEHKLIIYQCVLDLTTGRPLNVCVKKFFYEDIVAIETMSEAQTIHSSDLSKRYKEQFPEHKKYLEDGKLQLNSVEQFVLTSKAGVAVKINLPDPSIIESIGKAGNLPLGIAEQAIASVETMLDEKKKGIV